ncbi:MAG: nitroreductase family protein [Bacteroidales bacterium]
MKSFFSLIQSRRSSRKFKQEPVPQDVQKNLLQAALLSPASKRSNPWEFIAIDDADTITKLSESKPHGAAFLAKAPFAVVVIADPEKSDVWVEDTSIASIYLQLAAEDLGLGSCWIQIHKRNHESGTSASEYIKQLLDIPAQFEVESIIAIGYKESDRKGAELSDLLYERLHKGSFTKPFDITT